MEIKKVRSHIISANQVGLCGKSHILPSDYDRTPASPLQDIDTGRNVDAVQALNGLTRMDYQTEGDFITLSPEGDVLRIIRKRDPEKVDGSFSEFTYNSDGKRVPLTEDNAWSDESIGLVGDIEDVYNRDDIEFVSCYDQAVIPEEISNEIGYEDELLLDSDGDTLDEQIVIEEYVSPRDKYDCIYDATRYYNWRKRFIELYDFMKDTRGELPSSYWNMNVDQKVDYLNTIFKGDWVITKTQFKSVIAVMGMSPSARENYFEKKMDELIYSAPIFFPEQDKRVRLPAIKNAMKHTLSGKEIFALGNKTNTLLPTIKQRYNDALHMPLGKDRVVELHRVYDMLAYNYKTMKKSRDITIAPQCKAVLWEVKRAQEIEEKGCAAMPLYLFRRAMEKKYLTLVADNTITHREMRNIVSEKCSWVYSKEFTIND